MNNNALIKNYDVLRMEVETFYKDIISLIKSNTKAKELFKGCQILFSPLIHKPKIMFMGINPGPGYEKWHGKPVKKFHPEDQLEYLNGDNYTLAVETIQTFENAKLRSYLDNAVKSNYFYISTNNQKQLYEFLNIINSNLGIDPYALANKWTLSLLEIIEANTIICEGKASFDKINSLLGCKNLNWKNKSVISSVVNSNSKKIRLIGYKRRYSNIQNKDSLALALTHNFKS